MERNEKGELREVGLKGKLGRSLGEREMKKLFKIEQMAMAGIAPLIIS